jgi:transposase-like protein
MQPISILKEIYTFKDQDSLSFFLNSVVEGEPTESRIQKYLQFRNEKEGLLCPECGSEKYIKNGKTKTKKIQKYRCKRCGKGFSEFTNTFLFRIHKKDKLIDFYTMSDAEVSLEDCRKNLKLSKQTVFNWRHKGISAMKGIETENISGIAELMILEMSVSRKGERVNIDELFPKEEITNPKKRLQRVPKIKVPEHTNVCVQVSFCCNREHQM